MRSEPGVRIAEWFVVANTHHLVWGLGNEATSQLDMLGENMSTPEGSFQWGAAPENRCQSWFSAQPVNQSFLATFHEPSHVLMKWGAQGVG